MEKTGKGKPRSERSDLSDPIPYAPWCWDIHPHLAGVFLCFLQALGTKSNCWHDSSIVARKLGWLWYNFMTCKVTQVATHQQQQSCWSTRSSPLNSFLWIHQPIPQKFNPHTPYKILSGPKKAPQKIWWIFLGNSSDSPALCVAQLRHPRACW